MELATVLLICLIENDPWIVNSDNYAIWDIPTIILALKATAYTNQALFTVSNVCSSLTAASMILQKQTIKANRWNMVFKKGLTPWGIGVSSRVVFAGITSRNNYCSIWEISGSLNIISGPNT